MEEQIKKEAIRLIKLYSNVKPIKGPIHCAIKCVAEIYNRIGITCVSELEAQEYKYWSAVKKNLEDRL